MMMTGDVIDLVARSSAQPRFSAGEMIASRGDPPDRLDMIAMGRSNVIWRYGTRIIADLEKIGRLAGLSDV
jgi:hypothetical protein